MSSPIKRYRLCNVASFLQSKFTWSAFVCCRLETHKSDSSSLSEFHVSDQDDFLVTVAFVFDLNCANIDALISNHDIFGITHLRAMCPIEIIK